MKEDLVRRGDGQEGKIDEAQSFVIMIETRNVATRTGVRRSNQDHKRSRWRGRNTGEFKNSDGDLLVRFKGQQAGFYTSRRTGRP